MKFNIYKITGGQDIYVGSTELELHTRFMKHIRDYSRWKKGLMNWVSAFDIFEKVGVENCIIELLEECVCETIAEGRRKEGEYQRTIDCVNKRIERTRREYREDCKEKINQAQRDWRLNNKDKVEYRNNKVKCECGKEISLRNIARHIKTH
jgi:hypothetical protein